jgi:hypothetical protein
MPTYSPASELNFPHSRYHAAHLAFPSAAQAQYDSPVSYSSPSVPSSSRSRPTSPHRLQQQARQRSRSPIRNRIHPYNAPAESSRRKSESEVEVEAKDEDKKEGVKVTSGRSGNRRRQKYTRSRTGCLGCRVRRIKCDEGRPVCKRCQTSKRPVGSLHAQAGGM